MERATHVCNRRRYTKPKHYAWLTVMDLPSCALAVTVGFMQGLGGFFAGAYAGFALTVVTVVLVRFVVSRKYRD